MPALYSTTSSRTQGGNIAKRHRRRDVFSISRFALPRLSLYNPAMRRLFHVDSVSDAMGVYVSASVAGKAIGFARTLAFVHLLSQAPAEYNVWAIGSVLITLSGTAMCLGANLALTRYASVFQVRGELVGFLRRVAWPLLAMPSVLAVPVLLASGVIASWLAPAGQDVSPADVRMVQLAVLNGALLAVYLEMLGLMHGLRTYRLAAAVELFFSVLFLAVAVAWVASTRQGENLLWGHLVSLAVATAAGLWLTARATRDAGVSPALTMPCDEPLENAQPGLAYSMDQTHGTHNAGELAATKRSEDGTPASRCDASFLKLLRFGLPALAGQLAWLAAPFVGYYVVNRRIGDAEAGIFASWMLLAQMVYFAANAAWQVVYSHAARRWADDAKAAFVRMRTSYKGLALACLAASVVMYLAEPLWMHVLPAKYQVGRDVLGGLLMLYAAMTQMAVMTMTARLMEKPAATALPALAGGVVSAVLAVWWVAEHGAAGAAWAGGVGMLTGGTAAAAAWFVLRRVRVGARTYVVLLSPAILLAGWTTPWLAAVCLLTLVAAAFFTPAIFTREEKQEILRRLRRKNGTV